MPAKLLLSDSAKEHDLNPQQLESAWLSSIRQVWERVFVGIDHHSRQFTVSAASGAQFQANQGARGAGWMPVSIFAQDGLGYVEFLDWLASQFPGVPKERFTFVCEPTFSQPLCHFLASVGFEPARIQWVKTTEVGTYRKAKRIGKAGKNDHDDARALATMAFEEAALPHERRRLFTVAPHAPVAEGLRHLADDHARVSQQMVAVKNRITELVLRLFPECRRVWSKKESGKKPDGTVYEQRLLNLFGGELPTRILAEYPTARAIADAGFDGLWKRFGGPGIRKQVVRDLVELAGASAGMDSPLDAKRLKLLIGEYRHLEARLEDYKAAMADTLQSDPVLASLQNIRFLGPQAISTIVGALGDVSRFETDDAVKRYLNVAPVALPQTGDVDERGVPIQIWRLPTNSYKRVGGVRHLVYESPGLKTVRKAAYLWFEVLVKCAKVAPEDPFVQLYQRLKERHQGKPRWMSKVRWKVIAKMLTTIYHCLRKGVSYNPARVLTIKVSSGIPDILSVGA